jgi:hypothetical protein
MDELINTNTKVIERKDKEIRKEKEIVRDLKEEISKNKSTIEHL